MDKAAREVDANASQQHEVISPLRAKSEANEFPLLLLSGSQSEVWMWIRCSAGDLIQDIRTNFRRFSGQTGRDAPICPLGLLRSCNIALRPRNESFPGADKLNNALCLCSAKCILIKKERTSEWVRFSQVMVAWLGFPHFDRTGYQALGWVPILR